MSNALVELHCHILPGIDDGAKDLDMSMSLIRKELQDGAAGILLCVLYLTYCAFAVGERKCGEQTYNK